MIQDDVHYGASRDRRPTLRDVAAKAGLSIAAVSMALRDDPTIRASTTARVKQVALQLGYRPDPGLAALAAYRSRRVSPVGRGVMALVMDGPQQGGWLGRSHARRLVAAASDRALSLGYSLQHFRLREDGITPARLDGILAARGIRGLLLAPRMDGRGVPDLAWERYSVVAIGSAGSAGGARFHFVDADQFRAIFTCWEHLAPGGCRRIGLVADDGIEACWLRQWCAAQGYLQSLAGDVGDPVPSLLIPDSRDDSIGRIREWLRDHRPEAVISASRRFLEAAVAEGLSIPADIGYVSLDAGADFNGASGIRQRWDVVGESAVDVLHSLLIRNIRGASETALCTSACGTWIEGETLPPPRPWTIDAARASAGPPGVLTAAGSTGRPG